MVVIGYYTDDPIYRASFELLKSSLESNNLKYDFSCIAPSDWLQATAYKPTLIREKMLFHDEPVLYLDVDCFVHNGVDLSIFESKEDIALYLSESGEMLSGTVYLSKSDASFELLDLWIHGMEKNPKEWDQRILQRLIEVELKGLLSIKYIPVEYCFIFDSDKSKYPNVIPVIEHLQASREQKYEVKRNSLKYKLLGLLGVKPKVGAGLQRRFDRIAELKETLI